MPTFSNLTNEFFSELIEDESVISQLKFRKKHMLFELARLQTLFQVKSESLHSALLESSD